MKKAKKERSNKGVFLLTLEVIGEVFSGILEILGDLLS